MRLLVFTEDVFDTVIQTKATQYCRSNV